jgi:hypothetical protein
MEELKNTCIYCLSNEATYKNILCSHKLICDKCIIDVIYNKVPDVCPICRHKAIIKGKCMGAGCLNGYIPLNNNTEIKNGKYPMCPTCDLYMTLSYEQRKHLPEWFRNYQHIYGIWEKSNILYYPDEIVDTLCNLLSKFKEYNKWNGILCSFLDENNFLKEIDGKFYMLSVEQVDNIFDSMKNISDKKDNVILSSLVKICSYPWKLDIKKYYHGVCYYGNFTDEAIAFDAIKIIEKNIKRFIDKMSVDKYINSQTFN